MRRRIATDRQRSAARRRAGDGRRRGRVRADLLRRLRVDRRPPQLPGRARLARVHPLHGRRACSRRRIRGAGRRARRVSRRERVRRRARADRRHRSRDRRSGRAGRRRRARADGGRARAGARAWSRRGQARPDRLPLPLAGALREARLRRARAAVGAPGDAAGASPVPGSASGRPARSDVERLRPALHACPRARPERRAPRRRSRPARRWSSSGRAGSPAMRPASATAGTPSPRRTTT